MISLGLCLKELYRACPQAAQSFDQSTRWQLVGGRNLNGSCCIRAKKDSWNDEECPWLRNVVIKWNPPQVSEESERVSIRVSNWSDTFLMPGHALIFRACYVNMGIRGCHMFICVGFNSLSKAWEILTLTFQLCKDGMSFWIDFLVEEDEAVVLLLDDVVQHLGIHLQIRFKWLSMKTSLITPMISTHVQCTQDHSK